MSKKSVVLLVVEDNRADVVFLKEAVNTTALPVRMYLVHNAGTSWRSCCGKGSSRKRSALMWSFST